MNSFILIDGVIFWIVFALTLLTLSAMLWKSILKLRADKRLLKENRRLKAEVKALRFRLINTSKEVK